jgi:hypothetical protein
MEENSYVRYNTININTKGADAANILSICPYCARNSHISAASEQHVWFTETGHYCQSVLVTISWTLCTSCYLHLEGRKNNKFRQYFPETVLPYNLNVLRFHSMRTVAGSKQRDWFSSSWHHFQRRFRPNELHSLTNLDDNLLSMEDSSMKLYWLNKT